MNEDKYKLKLTRAGAQVLVIGISQALKLDTDHDRTMQLVLSVVWKVSKKLQKKLVDQKGLFQITFDFIEANALVIAWENQWLNLNPLGNHIVNSIIIDLQRRTFK